MKLALPSLILSAAILILAAALFFNHSPSASGSGYFGFASHLQTATTTAVGPDTTITLFADQTDGACKARVITTQGEGIRLSFDDTIGFGSTTLANTVGHWQDASTTVAYESGIYGCGRMTAHAAATTTLTISSF